MYQVSLSGQSGNSGMVSIGTNISSDNLSVTNASVVNMTVSNLKTTIFSPNVFNTSSLNASALTLSGTMLLLNVSKLNVCNLSCLHISATSITAPNVQPTLTAGDNVTIVNNVISASNSALLPSAINASSLSVTGSVIIGGETFISDSLLVTDTLQAGDFVCNGTITGTNLSTTALVFGNALDYASSSKTLSVATTGLVTQNSTTPITSGAVYSAINTSSSQLHNVQHFRGVTGTSEESVTPVDYTIAATVTGDVFFLNYYPKFENSYITVQMCFAYTFGVAGADSLYGRIVVGIQDNTSNVTIQDQRQRWNGTAGGGTRSGDIGMLQGTYKNTTPAGQFDRIKLEIFNQSTGDSFNLLYPEYISVMVTETLNLNAPAATNVYIGSGNISCNAISCLALSVNPGVRTLATIGYTEFGNASLAFDTACMSLKGNATETGYAFAQFTNHTTAMNSMPSSYLSFRHANEEQMVMRNSNFGINISEPTQRLTVVGNASIRGDLKCFGAITATGNVNALKLDSANASIDNLTCQNNANFLLNVSMNGSTFIQNLSVGDLTITGNVYGNTVTAGQNVTVVDNVISAFVEGTAELNISSLHIDNNANFAGVLNVSKTSTFEKSLNVKENLYGGEAGVKSGQLILYSLQVGNNAVIAADVHAMVIGGTGTITSVDTYLGFDKVFSITTTGVNTCKAVNISNNVNISGTLTADSINIESIANINACSVNASVGNFSALPIVNSSTGNFSALNADQFFSSNMTVSAPDNEATSFVIHNVSADKTNYALFQNADGQTDINSSNHLYFRTRGELKMKLDSAGQLGIGTLTPNALLHVSGTAIIDTSLQSPLLNTSYLNASELFVRFGSEFQGAMLIRNDLEVDNKITADNIRCIELLSGVNVCMTGQTQSFSFKATNRVNAPIVNVSILNVSQINISSITLNTFNASQLNASSIDGDLIVADEMVAIQLEAVTGAIDELTTIDLFTDVLYVSQVNASNLSCVNISLAELEAGEILCDGRITTVNMSATTISSTTLQSNQIFTPLLNTSYVNASELFVKFGSEFDGAMIIRNNLEVDNTLTAGDIISTGLISGSNISMTGQVTSSVLKANNRVNAPTMNASVLNGSSLNVTGVVNVSQVNAYAVSVTELLEAGDIVCNGNSSLTNISATTFHSTNISGVNGSFTYLTADNLQETLIAGPGIAIVDRTISTQQILVAGTNIDIIGEVISTTSLLNISNVSSEKGIIVNLSCTNLSATSITASNVQPTLIAGSNLTLVGTLINTSSNLNISNVSAVSGSIYTFEADTIETIGLNSQGIFADEADITTVNAIDVDTNTLTCLTGTITNLSSTNISATRSTITNMSSTDFNSTRSTITNMSCSNLSVSNKVSLLNVSGTNATFTSLTANNVQPTLTAGSNLTLVGNVINTSSNLNISNVSAVNGFIYTFEADTIETIGLNSQGIFADEADITTVRAIGVDTNTLTCLTGRITNLSSTNISGARGTITNFSSTNSSATRGTITNISCSNISCSLKINVLNVSGTNATFTSLTAPNVQPTLTAGTNITIVGTTISSSATLVAGTNIDITSGVIKTTSNVNLSNLSTDVLHSPVIVSNLITSIDGEIDILNADISVTTPFLAATNISSTNGTFTSLTTTNLNVSQLSTHNICAVNEIQASIVNASTIIAGDAFSVLSSTLSTSFYTDFVDDQKFVLKVTGVGSPSAPKLAFRTGTADALLITQSSNVSIANTLTVGELNTSVINGQSLLNVSSGMLVKGTLETTDVVKQEGFSRKESMFIGLQLGNIEAATGSVFVLHRFGTRIFNTSMYSSTINSVTLKKIGNYMVTYTINWDCVSINDRVVVKSYFSGGGIEQGYSYAYIRDDNFGNFGSTSSTFFLEATTADVEYSVVSVCKIGTGTFGAAFDGLVYISGSTMVVEYIGSS